MKTVPVSGDVNWGAGAPPSRDGPPQSVPAVSTGGLFPRDYRRRLRDKEGPFCARSEFGATTVHYRADSPILGTALHYHHDVREDIAGKLALDDAGRYYEEDPETHRFLGLVPHCITPNMSRYEVDLNRPPDTAFYAKPSLAWGQEVWSEPLQQFEKEFTLERWYEAHTMMDCAVEHAIETHGYCIVFDFHSYNYQRKGETDWRSDGKPVINIGTRHLDLDAKGKLLVDGFVADVKQHTVLGEDCLVEENGVFYGGYLNRRLSHLFGPRAITLSVEYKKVYMDERTGRIHQKVLDDLVQQMDDSIRRLAESLEAPVLDRSDVPVESPYLAA